jgi:hypothetical protein
MTTQNVYPNDRPGEAAKKVSKDGNWFVVPENGKGAKEKGKKINVVQKYSEPGLLAEAVIIGGVPYFAVSKLRSRPALTGSKSDRKVMKIDTALQPFIAIDDAKTEYRPFELSTYLNQPYTFSSEEDFK